MTDNDTGSFRLGELEEAHEFPPVEDNEMVALQLKAINRRYRWFLLFTILIVGALFAVGYLDLKNRFSVQQSSGSREIENITTIFEDRFNELQKRIEELDAAMAEEMAALDQKTVVWQKDLAKLRSTVDKLDLSGAIKKEQKSLLLAVRKELDPLDQNVKSLQSELAGMDQKLSKEIKPLADSVARNAKAVGLLQERIGPETTTIVNRDQMDLELLKIKKAYRQNLSAEIAGVEKQIRLLRERIERIEIRPTSGNTSPATSGSPGRNQSPSTGATGIQEQNLP
jgi:hypothetical protein